MAGKVEFHDRSEDTIKAMASLAKKGLRKGAQIIKKQALANMTPAQQKNVGKLLTGRASISRRTGQPYAEVGYVSKTSSARYKKLAKGVKWMPNPSWLEFGTKAHTITAGNRGAKKGITGKRALSNGATIFRRTVSHPGAKGQQPVTRAGNDKRTEARDAVLPYLQQIAAMSDSELIREALSMLEDLEEE